MTSSLPKLPPWLSHALRVGFAALVIWILIRTGALNPALLAKAVTHHPWLYVAGFFIYLVPLQLLAWGRWWMLLRAAKVPITALESLRLHLTGLFFNGFLPGGTGGDLAKGWYLLKGRNRTEAAGALGTLVADRITGLFGLIGVAAAANLLNAGLWASSPVLGAQALFILSVAAGMIVLAIAYLFPWKRRRPPLPKASDADSPAVRGFLAEFGLALAAFRKTPGVFVAAVFFSVCVHGLLVVIYALCAGALDVSLPLTLHAYVAPTLTFANGIPVSPAGLGVGEAAGVVLYKAVGATHGFAEIPALVHGLGLLIALLCAPAYLWRKEPKHGSTTAQQQDNGTA